MKKAAKKRPDRRKVEDELDKELEGTFPASDPLKIVRGKPAKRVRKKASPSKQR